MDIKEIARIIWNIRREDEDRCDLELEDIPQTHSVWKEAEALVAEIQRQSEPVGIIKWNTGGKIVHIVGDVKPGDVIFTFPPDKAQIEQSVAEACAEYVSMNLFSCGEYAEAIRSGEWKKFRKGE